ncbi:AAA family ATPase [Luteolibacter marinus]|uniref:AAA family ATPase n=1 Tax=Luteolibacter marinus TaxID=2776705 RepID=UPI00186916D2|nr:AAA family ATPase [Luteolibacter marinus]
MNLTTYLRAGYPGLALVTPEEARAEAELARACADLNRHLHAWSSTDGLVDTTDGHSIACSDPLEALGHVENFFRQEDTRHVVMLRDLQLHLDQQDPILVRQIKDLLRLAKSTGHTLVPTGCRLKLPPELEHELAVIDLDLPDCGQLGHVLDGILASAQLQVMDDTVREQVLHAALGLTTIEAENAYALSLVESGSIDPELVAREKARTLKQGGLVEVIDARPNLGDIGGLDSLKHWLTQRRPAFGAAARDYGLPVPKGLLIVGIPGTGKSLTAKATASVLQLPLLRLDMGRVFGGIVGQSEANLRSVIRTAEAIAPCVLWIDEIEKGFGSSTGGSGSDGGTSARVFGSFLSWMQEKDKPVFVVATANDVSQLPPEFLRKGRFDEMFFVDLPDAAERAAIWDIVIAKYGRKPTDFDTVVLARACEQFTGAEIEAVFVDALYEAFAEGAEPSTRKHILTAMTNTVPLAQRMDGQIAALRHWARGRARPAGAEDPVRSSGRRSSRRVQSQN